ncbi:MAG: hypothetical protein Ct9H300mP23_02830 [Nitrospinota bacterium]|nr:MAG: hypothetical protein Ct9H300mP23_02830 [Nitrospinota bacterium]
MFAVFGIYVFANVIQHCREKGGINTPLWGGFFGCAGHHLFYDDSAYVRPCTKRSVDILLLNLPLAYSLPVVSLGSFLQK